MSTLQSCQIWHTLRWFQHWYLLSQNGRPFTDIAIEILQESFAGITPKTSPAKRSWLSLCSSISTINLGEENNAVLLELSPVVEWCKRLPLSLLIHLYLRCDNNELYFIIIYCVCTCQTRCVTTAAADSATGRSTRAWRRNSVRNMMLSDAD